MCRTPRVLPLFPPCRQPDRRAVCPEPNPAVLGLCRESRERALLCYVVLHDGEVLCEELRNTRGEFPDDTMGDRPFTRPKTGPVKVYYNPDIDIVLITEGLEGLTIRHSRPRFSAQLYDRQLGYHLSHIETLGIFWCHTGAICGSGCGSPREFDRNLVRRYAYSVRNAKAFSYEFITWISDFTRLVCSAQGVLPKRLALLDVLNPDPVTALKIGSGIYLFCEGSEERCNEAYREVPRAFESMLSVLEIPRQAAAAMQAPEDADSPPEASLLARDVMLCRVRSTPDYH